MTKGDIAINVTREELQELITAHQSAAIKKAAAGKDSSYHEQRIEQLHTKLAQAEGKTK